MFWVYILGCSDGNYYTGHTGNLERRMGPYQAGESAGYIANPPTNRTDLVARDHNPRSSVVGGAANQRLEPQEERSHDPL
ncbi:MAG: GIY-YIG nuclease family protein [Methylococcales bacterium]